MSHLHLLSVLGASTLLLSLPIVGCGGYAADNNPTGSGGAAASGGSDAASGGSDVASGGSDVASGGSDVASGGSGGREEVPDASCEGATSCGGDPVSVWFAMDSCLTLDGTASVSSLGVGCSEAPVVGTIEVNGNFTVNADGSISDNTTTIADLTLELAAECLMVSGTVTNCDRVGGVMVEQAGANSGECLDSTVTEGGCTCTLNFDQSGAMAYLQGVFAGTSGTYTNMDNTLSVRGTITDASLGPTPLDYGFCVDGNFMHVTPTAESIWGLPKGEIVLQRQDG